MMEVFLRFTHRYWFHEVSQPEPRAQRLRPAAAEHLGNDELYEEVRHEVVDMSNYLDSDSARRQANTVLRLTVVTILGLIGTVASGLLGMNLLDEAHRSLRDQGDRLRRRLAGTFVVTIVDGGQVEAARRFPRHVSDDRVGWRAKWKALRQTARRAARSDEPTGPATGPSRAGMANCGHAAVRSAA